ncbi:MAG: exodeoxyribonuclease VII large subunit [Moraxellaceae bacterium]|nr:exodeoxyribonuclease VII large subunit [Moraxellaceae bacterium]
MSHPVSPSPRRHVLTVTLLNEQVRDMLENSFPNLWVEGEISNLSQPSSGHLYFTLKDAGGQIRAAMFRGNNRFLPFVPKNGQQVVVKARLSLYAPRGDYQLIVEQMEEAGLGALRRAFDALRLKLQQEGLFEAARKRELPERVRHLAVITSATGAAIRDILSVLERRFPGLPVTVIPVPVQGTEAAPAIVRAIALANREAKGAGFDAILLARGGGSLEDLWAFNEEAVARAIADSELPVVSGVGHETDFTIADFVADVRAPTPSAAAELLSPDGEELAATFAGYEVLLERALRVRLARWQQQLAHLRARLRHPGQRLTDLAQKLDELELRLVRAQQRNLQQRAQRLAGIEARLRGQHPGQRLPALQRQLVMLNDRLTRSLQLSLRERQQRLAHLAERAQLASPLAILARGYAVVTHNSVVLRNASDAAIGDTLITRLAHGTLTSRVTATEPATTTKGKT